MNIWYIHAVVQLRGFHKAIAHKRLRARVLLALFTVGRAELRFRACPYKSGRIHILLPLLDEPALDSRALVGIDLPQLVSNLLGIHTPCFLLTVPP